MSLFYLVFITDHTHSDRSLQLNFIFSIDHIYTIYNIVVLFSFHPSRHLVQLVITVQYHFRHRPYLYDRSCHCPNGFHHNRHPIRSIMIVQFYFRCRLLLYDRTWFSSHTVLDVISLCSLVSFSV